MKNTTATRAEPSRRSEAALSSDSDGTSSSICAIRSVSDGKAFFTETCWEDEPPLKRMKTHKRMDFNELLSEVLSALSMFQPQPKFIKQRIEKLIQDEFLARDEQDKSILVYLP